MRTSWRARRRVIREIFMPRRCSEGVAGEGCREPRIRCVAIGGLQRTGAAGAGAAASGLGVGLREGGMGVMCSASSASSWAVGLGVVMWDDRSGNVLGQQCRGRREAHALELLGIGTRAGYTKKRWQRRWREAAACTWWFTHAGVAGPRVTQGAVDVESTVRVRTRLINNARLAWIVSEWGLG